ncbi:MAG: LPS export ABC transporter periplasmic protein LptC [bacterium]|nr:LPS export ABC transporter periplasmic protein LptC [bacterium]MDD5755734.1 LPS export ABC transporter periplasmic protein LptC [bacterium]
MNKKIVFILLIGLVIAGCKGRNNNSGDLPPVNAEQFLEKFSMVETQAGKKQWELEAARALLQESEQQTKLEKIKLKFYKEEVLTSVLIAEKGDINTETGDMIATGNVVFTSETEKVKVETDQLNWDNKRKKIVTDSFVKETRPGGIVTGYGLEAEPDLSRSVIKREVKAQVIPQSKEMK